MPGAGVDPRTPQRTIFKRLGSDRKRCASWALCLLVDMAGTTDRVPHVTLRPEVEIPQLGFGVFQIPPKETEEVVARALQAGYRHIDTAAAYGNEGPVGQAIHASGIPREEIFVTTKCFNDDHGKDRAKRACKASLERSELEHIDLYLIHWPVPSHDLYVETWQAFIELQAEGLVRAIGVSNFQPAHLERIVAETGDRPRDQPDRAAPLLPAGRPAPRARRARHRDRGVEPARPGDGARRPDDRRDRARRMGRPPPRRSSAGTCSSATS